MNFKRYIENEFNYTVKNIRSGTKGYKLFINPFEKVKFDNYVRQEGFNINVIIKYNVSWKDKE